MSEPIHDGYRVIKCGGHCYNGTGWVECYYWDRSEATEDDPTTKCKLFGSAPKYASVALTVCNKVYGYSYEGQP